MKIFWILFVLLSVIYSNISIAKVNYQQGYKIQGYIENLSNGAKVFLMDQNLDTVFVTYSLKNEFKFQGNLPLEGVNFFIFIDSVNSGQKYVPLFLENSNILIKGDLYKWPNVLVTGSSSDKDFKYLLAEQDRILNLGLDAKASDDSLLNTIKKFVIQNSSSLLSPFLLYNNNQFETEFIKNEYHRFTERVQKSNYGILIKSRIDAFNNSKQIGLNKVIPDLVFSDTASRVVSLNDLVKQNEITLVDFWASWCVPCREQTPYIKDIYKDFGSRGLGIVSISLDLKLKAWKQAIETEGMNWMHLSDLKGWNSDAKTVFELYSIPQYILLDKNGKIISTNLVEDKSMKCNKIRKAIEEYLSKT